MTFLEKKVGLKRPKDPTDIIWENRGRKKWKRVCLFWFMLYNIFSVGAYNCVLVFTKMLNLKQQISYMTNSPGINCDNVRTRYGDNLVDMAYAEYQYRVLNNFTLINDNYDGGNETRLLYLNENISRTGAIGCFCKGEDGSTQYEVTLPSGETT